MPRLLLVISLAVLAAALTAASPARAGWYPAETIDGPSADILESGGIDIARDGTGGLVYVKADGGVPHIFLSRHIAGAWRAPERVDIGIETAGSQPVIAAADGYRLAIAWISGGRVHGSVVPAGTGAGPLAAPTQLYADPDPLRAAADPHIDMGINGTAYVVFAAPGSGGSDVRAARLQDATWEGVGPALDIEAAQPAGEGKGRPRVAVSAEGNAVAVWGEGHADGRNRVYGRRITGLNLSLAPQEISLASFEGKTGGAADSPDLEIEDDGSYAWAVFRQDFDGASRAIARRLVGSLFEGPSPVEATGFAEHPRIGMTGRGAGFAVSGLQGSFGIHGNLLYNDLFGAPAEIVAGNSDRPPLPVVEMAEKDHTALVWRGPAGSVRARHKPSKEAWENEVTLTDPALGTAADEGLELAEDRSGNFAATFLQGGVTDRRLMVAVYDRPPGLPTPTSTENNQNRSRPTFKWRAGLELWGPVTFRVILDGEEIGRTGNQQFTASVPVDDGPHRWRVVAVDRRGQENPSRERTLRIDKTPPDISIRFKGKKKAGAPLKYTVTADDFGGSGIKTILIDWGDKTRFTYAAKGLKRFRAGKVYRVRLKAVDKAGNVRNVYVKVRIKK